MTGLVPTLDLDRLAPKAAGGVRIVPVVHDRVEMAPVAKAVLDAIDPVAVAIELPAAVGAKALAAVRRLPKISLVLTQEPGEEALVWVSAPGDPFVEAIRWALERGREVIFIDPDIPYPELHVDPVPDPYAILSLGPERYLELVGAAPRQPSDLDERREAGMAFHLQRARRRLADGEVVAFVGAAHASTLSERMAEPTAQPFARRRRSTVTVRHLDPESLTAILPDAPLAHAVWERLRTGESPRPTELATTVSKKVSIVRFGLRVIAGEGGEEEAARRLRLVAYATDRGTRTTSCGLVPDRAALGRVVWRVAAGSYREQTDEPTAAWQRRLFADYASRLARLQRQLVPGLYEWVVAGRGVGDDNLAWEVFDAARAYPWQGRTAEIETVTIDGDELDLGTRRIRFRRRFLRVKRRPVAVPVRSRRKPDDPTEWLAGFDGEGLCSHPPEDLVIEDYGRFLQHKAVSNLAAERTRTEPFTTSFLDGIDIRETLRQAHDGRIHVRERGRVAGSAGSVVVIFDRDPDDERCPFKMTWLGEHDQESDMAFYSTNPADQVVGPGIMRATYGGFMLTLPRGRLADVWDDPDYRFARDKAELLAMAAIDYSEERYVVHVAAVRPSSRLREYAAAFGKRLLHVPLGSLSPVTAKKVRVVHLLTGKSKRAIADQYVW